jgi:outer membrane protein, heavy metal efflux system
MRVRVRTLLPTLLFAVWSGSASADEEAALAREADPAVILRVAMARNLDLKEEQARIAAANARTKLASRLPDPRLKYEQWGVPLKRPWALDRADTLMLGVSQSFPAPGTLDAQERLAAQEAQSATATEHSRRQDLRAQIRRAFADYYRANRQVQLHREHLQLTTQLVELARASYRTGRTGQQDVLRLSLELSRQHSDLAHITQEERSAVALLNALMNRAADAPLGPPVEIAPPSAVAVSDGVEGRRSEVAAARAAVRRSEAAVDLARREARWPMFMVGADYWYMPMLDDPHGYGAMVSMTLPWLNPGKRDAIRAAEDAASADRFALESVRNTVRYEVRDAMAKYEAARSTFTIIDADVLPQAQRNFQAAQAGYSAGHGDAIGLIDALRSYLEVRLDRVRALVHLETAAADLERATGGDDKEKTP